MMKTISIRLEDSMLADLKKTAKIYNENYINLIREGINKVLNERHEYPLYKLVSDVEYCSKEEEKEIMTEINSLTGDDLKVVERRRYKL